jgi:hypothetical protein
MSYDLQLIPRATAAAWLVRFESHLADDDLEINPGPAVPEKEAWKNSLRGALTAFEPAFEAFRFGFDEIAKSFDISEAEARIRYRHIELNLPDEDPTGIQITLFDDTVSLTVPYWHIGSGATEVFRKIWGYLALLEREGNLATHDPQLDRMIDLQNDFDEVLSRYLRISTRLPEIIEQSAPSKKPWWKFW